MKFERKIPDPAPPPPVEYVLTLTAHEAATVRNALYDYKLNRQGLGEHTSRDVVGDVWEIMYELMIGPAS